MIVKIEGLSTNYEVYGQGERLLLLHGWATNLQSFGKVGRLLSQNFQVISLDLPGFGLSQPPQTTYGVFDYAAFVEKFLNYLDVNQVSLLGHSMGGAVTIAYALNHSRAKKLILEDSAGIRRQTPWNLFKIHLFKTLKVLTPPEYQERLKHIFGSNDYRNAGPMRSVLIKILNEDLTPRLKDVTQPTLILWGEDDKTTGLSDGKIMNHEIRGSQLAVMDKCDHFPHLEYPDKFVEIVTAFLKVK